MLSLILLKLRCIFIEMPGWRGDPRLSLPSTLPWSDIRIAAARNVRNVCVFDVMTRTSSDETVQIDSLFQRASNRTELTHVVQPRLHGAVGVSSSLYAVAKIFRRFTTACLQIRTSSDVRTISRVYTIYTYIHRVRTILGALSVRLLYIHTPFCAN